LYIDQSNILTAFFRIRISYLCCKQDSDQDSYLLDQDWSRTRNNLSPNTSGVQAEPYQPHSIHPTWGSTLPHGPKIHSRQHLAPQRNFDPSNGNMKHWKSVKLESPLKEKYLYIILL